MSLGRSALWVSPAHSSGFSCSDCGQNRSGIGSASLPFCASFAANYSYADGPYTVGPHSGFKDSTGSKTTTDRLDDARGGSSRALYAALLTVAHPGDSIAIARLRVGVSRESRHGEPGIRGNQILQYHLLDRAPVIGGELGFAPRG